MTYSEYLNFDPRNYTKEQIDLVYAVKDASIKELRTLTGLSQGKFANAYNITLSSIQNWESGRYQAIEATITLLRFAVLTNLLDKAE